MKSEMMSVTVSSKRRRRLFWHGFRDGFSLGPLWRWIGRKLGSTPRMGALSPKEPTSAELESALMRTKRIVGAFVAEPDAQLIVDLMMGELTRYDQQHIGQVDDMTFHLMVRVCIELYFKGPIPPRAVSGTQWAEMQTRNAQFSGAQGAIGPYVPSGAQGAAPPGRKHE